jgi:hypothetical protein
MNAEWKDSSGFQFITHHSAFIISAIAGAGLEPATVAL